jgi:hypothetical protein
MRDRNTWHDESNFRLKQMGLDAKAMEDLLFMVRGDGTSVAAIAQIKKYLSAHPDDYKSF